MEHEIQRNPVKQLNSKKGIVKAVNFEAGKIRRL